jgi:FdhD protein
MDGPGIKQFAVDRYVAGTITADLDSLTIEEPLEIRVSFRRGSALVERSVSITMRTPGHDRELAVGFLFTEGVIHHLSWIDFISEDTQRGKSLLVQLNHPVDLQRLERHFYTSSSCGVCGKTSLESLEANRVIVLPPDAPRVTAETLLGLSGNLAACQKVFSRTGSLHAAAFFDKEGKLLVVKEDVGRHNAVDKLIGSELLQGNATFGELILMVSGRAGFELVQKALMAGVPFFAAVGAPSSIAVELARRYRSTLVGFLRGQRFNVYAGRERISNPARVVFEANSNRIP